MVWIIILTFVLYQLNLETMSRIIIEYNPQLSVITQKLIEANITPSMSSNDESSHQYDIDMVAELLEENNRIDDLTIINQYREDDVNYIEF